MRGRTLNHAFIILDEAQNTTPEQMKMFLTRIGFGAKAVVTGDVTQIDLRARPEERPDRGAAHPRRRARHRLHRVQRADVVRHPLVARIVDAYDKTRDEQRRVRRRPSSTQSRAARRARAPALLRRMGARCASAARRVTLRIVGEREGRRAEPRRSAQETTRPTCCPSLYARALAATSCCATR